MKNKISTLIAMLAFATYAQAQWIANDKDYDIIGKDGIYGQCGMKTLRTTDGKTVLTWLNIPEGIRYDDPSFGYYLYMQTFDKNGTPLFGKEGMIISQQPTMSYVTDYGMELTKDDNIIISYSDTRNDATNQKVENFLYCYTPEGESVWSKDGIKIHSLASRKNYEDIMPILTVSGSGIYGIVDHIEHYKEKANETNWQPSPWFPDEEMPDSVDMEDTEYQIMRYANDGSQAWTTPLQIASNNVWTYPAPDDGLYIIYENKGFGIDARRIDKNGKDVWTEPINVESGIITDGSYTVAPTVVEDGKGGLMLLYRKLLSYSGYIVANRITPEGSVYSDEFIVNGTQDGNGTNPLAAVNGDRMFTAFSYTDINDNQCLWINQLDCKGDYTWEGDSLLGYSYDQNETWGMKAVKVIPQDNGWVLLYGNAQSWNGANFYVVKIDFDGNTMWKKQIAEDDFKSSGFSIVNDEKNAYIFYTCDKEIDDNWEEIPGKGGMRMMCVDITDNTNSISHISNNATSSHNVYNIYGMRTNDTSHSGIYIVKDSNKATKVFIK